MDLVINAIAAIVGVATLVYLFIAIVRPEWF